MFGRVGAGGTSATFSSLVSRRRRLFTALTMIECDPGPRIRKLIITVMKLP